MNDGYNYNHNYGYGYRGYNVALSDGGNYAEIIKPNIESSYKSAKRKKNFFTCLIPVCIIFFMGGFILTFMTGDPFDGPNFAFLPFSLVGFIGFPICGVLIGLFTNKVMKLQKMIALISEIQVRDKTGLDDLSLSRYISKSGIVLVINKLIQTNNLIGYEVIGNVGVARTELRAKERDFVSATVTDALKVATENVQKRYRCPSCGAAITEKTGKFCTFCGTRLE